MLGILAYYHNAAFSLDYLALFADLLYGWFNLHCIIPYLSLRILLLLVAGLFCAPSDTSFCEVINRYLNRYLITGQYSDIVHSELAGDMCVHYMSVRKLNLEVGIGQRLNYRTFKFNNIILWQNNPSSAIISVTYTSTLPALIHKGSDYNSL